MLQIVVFLINMKIKKYFKENLSEEIYLRSLQEDIVKLHYIILPWNQGHLTLIGQLSLFSSFIQGL